MRFPADERLLPALLARFVEPALVGAAFFEVFLAGLLAAFFLAGVLVAFFAAALFAPAFAARRFLAIFFLGVATTNFLRAVI